MTRPARRLLRWMIVPAISAAIALVGRAARRQRPHRVGATGVHAHLPDEAFAHAPEKPHDTAAHYFEFSQLEHRYRVPGEFTRRLIGDQYGFQGLSFIITETHPGGGPGFHMHDTEEAHVLLEGSVQYRIGEETFTVDAPYVAKVPAGVPHTFINVGSKPFSLIAVFASKHPNTTRIGPNPLLSARTVRMVSDGPPSPTV